MCASLALLLLVAQNPPRVTLDFRDTALEQVLGIMEAYAGAKFEVAPQYEGRKVSLKAQNLTVAEALGIVAKDLGGRAKAIGKDRYRLAPEWQHAILDKLEKEKVHDLLMKDVEVGQALRLFRSQCGVDVHSTVDPKRKISLKADDVDYRAVLDAIADAAEAEWELRYGVAYLAPKGELARLPLLPPKLAKRPTLPLRMEDTLLEDALRFLKVVTKRRFEWPEDLPADRVTVRAKSVTLDQALALILYPAGFTATEKKDTIVVVPRK